MHLIQVDVIRLQAAQRILDLLHDPLPGAAAVVRPVVHRHEELRREHDVVAATLQGLADDLFRHTAGVHVSGVDEVDPGIECAMDDADRVGAVVVAPRPNIIVPRHSGLTDTPVRPSSRYSMSCSCRLYSAGGDVVDCGEAVEGAGVADEGHEHDQHGEQPRASVADPEVPVDVPPT